MGAHRRGPRWNATVVHGFRSFARTETGHVYADSETAAIASIRAAYSSVISVSVKRARFAR